MIFFCKPKLVLLVSMAVLSHIVPVAAQLSNQERGQIKHLNELAQQATRDFSSGELLSAMEKMQQVQQELLASVQSRNDPALQRQLQPIYERLVKVRSLLEVAGAELPKLDSWQEICQRASGISIVNFEKDIAPWLVAKCGECHIDNRRGNFSMATLADLMRGSAAGVVLFPGSRQGSRIVEIIENGDMPRGGNKVESDELEQLRQWIAQGAQVGQLAPGTELRSLVKAMDLNGAGGIPVHRPTGEESVSFSRDIAPLLAEKCQGCHFGGQQAAGGLRMDSIIGLLRGGDSGPVLTEGDAMQSLLVKRLRGEAGERMPSGGREPFSEAQLKLVEAWIQEGCAFDGQDVNADFPSIADSAWAQNANHENLFLRRKTSALATWSLFEADKPQIIEDQELMLFSSVSVERSEAVFQQAKQALADAKKLLNLPPEQPLVHGGWVLFLLANRYQYAEFGKMVEKRDLPTNWNSHWTEAPILAYSVMVSNADNSQVESQLLELVTGVAIGSLGAPYWFASGTARSHVVATHRRSDPRVSIWLAGIPNAGQGVANARSLMDGAIDEEAAANAGLAIVLALRGRGNQARFNRLVQLLRTGRDFEASLKETFDMGEEQLIVSWLGKK